MQATAAGTQHAIVPRRREKYYLYHESLDEPVEPAAFEE